MKTAISIPDPLFRAADRLAKRMHVSRSRLYASAVSEFVNGRERGDVRERLDRIYGPGGQTSSLPRDLAVMQSMSLGSGEW